MKYLQQMSLPIPSKILLPDQSATTLSSLPPPPIPATTSTGTQGHTTPADMKAYIATNVSDPQARSRLMAMYEEKIGAHVLGVTGERDFDPALQGIIMDDILTNLEAEGKPRWSKAGDAKLLAELDEYLGASRDDME